MDIGIMTFQNTSNYGALLQTMALHTMLNDLNINNEIISYRCEEIERREISNSIINDGIAHAPISLLSNYIKKQKYRKMQLFKKKYCKVSKKTYDRNNICEALNHYDRFLVGSDIVWELNVTGGDFAYYLDFVPEKNRKYSFSSSFGYDEIPQQFISRSRELLDDFTMISVREDDGARIISELIDKKVPVTLDPTLLLRHSDWVRYEERYRNVPCKGYVLVYFDDEQGSALSYAKKLAEEKCLKILFIRNSLRPIKGVKSIRQASVEQFLWLIDNAAYVVTGSYHGVVFSINFNTPFYYVNRAHFGRIDTIVQRTGLEKRNIKCSTISKDDIQWNQVNCIIEEMRELSINRLKEISR